MCEKPTENKQNLFEDYLGYSEDGQQILVTVWHEGNVTVAYRADRWATWSRPIRCEKYEVQL